MNAQDIMKKYNLKTLVGTNLSGVNLHKADLYRANLREANLRGADLSGAYICGANLHRADLHEANLYKTDLRWADLSGVNLSEANLYMADLRGADLSGASYTVSQMLLADWGHVSDKLCLWLMRLDCSACPDGKAGFEEWLATDTYSFAGPIKRIVTFKENKDLWSFGPPPSMWTIWKRLCKEKDIKL